MEKQQWQDLYTQLDSLLTDFNLAYAMHTSATNKQDINNADSNAKKVIFKAKRQIERHPEVYKLITGGNVFLYDEFFIPKYFTRDMPALLTKIKDKL
ncbi:MAG: hypothetical protein PF444_01925 [Bacteroidales bacterium]|jgi:hypothetical protein|nr:hypothetical protein [Bacteroidales bacterium]